MCVSTLKQKPLDISSPNLATWHVLVTHFCGQKVACQGQREFAFFWAKKCLVCKQTQIIRQFEQQREELSATAPSWPKSKPVNQTRRRYSSQRSLIQALQQVDLRPHDQWSIATLVLSCSVSEILQVSAENSDLAPIHLFEFWGFSLGPDRSMITNHQPHRQTDGRTDNIQWQCRKFSIFDDF